MTMIGRRGREHLLSILGPHILLPFLLLLIELLSLLLLLLDRLLPQTLLRWFFIFQDTLSFYLLVYQKAAYISNSTVQP